MVIQINTKPNTFYRAKNLDDDVGVMPVYGDAYVGLTPTYDLISSPNSTYYLGESTIITENDFVYGDGVLSECYLNLYTNNLTQVHPQTAPWVDVYGLTANTDLIEGNLSIDTTVGDISAYSSIYNMETPWIVEDFDGTNKFFINKPSRTMVGFYRVQGDFLEITAQSYIDAVVSTYEGSSKNEHSGILSWSNIVEEGTRAVDYAQSRSMEAANWYIQGVQEAVNWLIPGVGPYTNPFEVDNVKGFPDNISLTKHSDGLYYYELPGSQRLANMTATEHAMMANTLSEGHSRGWWVARGAKEFSVGFRGGADQYSHFDETYITPCDQYNSIFTTVFKRGMARDIKSETTGGQGDDERPLAYVSADLVTDDVASDGNAFRMKLFWENYSGSLTGYSSIDGANYFGYGSVADDAPSLPSGTKHPLPQCIVASIENIPAPAMYDITTPTLVPSVAPEIEIIFKIAEMPSLPFSISGTEADDYDDRGREISRSFNIRLGYFPIASGSTEDPLISENLADNGPNSVFNFGGGGELNINFCKTGQGNNIDVVGYWNTSGRGSAADVGNTEIYRSDHGDGYYGMVYKVIPGSTEWETRGYDPYHTTIPEGEWVKMRIKFGNKELTSGSIVADKTPWRYDGSGDVIAYFPEILETNGQMKKIQVWSPYPCGPNTGFFPNTFTLWANNMRAINEVKAAHDGDFANNGYTQIDDVPSDDKIVDVLIDKIGFHGWGTLTNNASVTLQNGMGSLLKLPNVKGIPVATTNDKVTIRSSISGSDNYYGDYSHPIATYLSLGYDSSGTADAGVQNHQLLFNDFFTASPATVSQIPYLKAGYFTSGNYEDSANWFGNLTMGGLATDNIRIGGVDNYIDGFVSKGLMRVSSSFTDWVRSGNPYIAAKILTISADGTEITVDKGNIFNTSEDQRFVVEVMGRSNSSSPAGNYNFPAYLSGSGSKGYVGELTQAKPHVGNTIYLNDSILYDDQNQRLGMNTGGLIDYAQWNSANRLRISPYKYWVNMALVNVASAQNEGGLAGITTPSYQGSSYIWLYADYTMSSSATAKVPIPIGSGAVIRAYGRKGGLSLVLPGASDYDTYPAFIISSGSDYQIGERIHFIDPADATNVSAYTTVGSTMGGWGYWYDKASGGTATPLAPRSYNTIVPVSGGSTRGTTFNETLYNDGVDANVWNLNFMNPESNYVINNIDYGQGVIDEPAGEEGATTTVDLTRGKGAGYISREYLVSGQNYINLNNYIRVAKPRFGDDFNFMVVPSYMMTQGSSYTINFNTDDATTNPAQLIYGIKDLVPQIEEFRVAPSINLLEEKVDIYTATKGTATDVKFTWKENASDVWYRMLMVDSTNIFNKYHRNTFRASLNETTTGSYRLYTSSTDTTGVIPNVEQVSSSIEGFRGYGANFDGTNGTRVRTNDATVVATLSGATEFTFVAHGYPTKTSGQIFYAANQLSVQINASGKVIASIWNNGAVSYVNLTGTTILDLDGLQPLNVVVTFNTIKDSNNAMLYVNGNLEDVSADGWTKNDTINTTTPSYFYIGALDLVTNPYGGFLEEVLLYNKEYHMVPNAGEYILNTSHYPDLTDNNSNYYHARLFVFDYHNITGRGRTDVGKSHLASWKVTGV
tara:strand:- start:2783 stop:7630 length:4848 start_codon:yes stop_codon:yes gene_type:complete